MLNTAINLALLEPTFERIRLEQAQRHGRVVTPFDLRVNTMTLEVGKIALADALAPEPRSRIRVVSAPTGAGKTTSTTAFAAAMLSLDPDYSCAFVVETVRQAQEVYEELVAMVPREEVVVWTRAHDIRTTTNDNLRDHGFDPGVRFHADQLRSSRCVVVTHAKLVREENRDRDKGVRLYQGHPRTQMFVDEHPQMVRLIEMTPGDMMKFRDIFKREDPDHPMVPVVDRVVDRMDEAFSSKGASYVPVELVDFGDMATIDPESRRAISLTRAEDLPDGLFKDALSFIKAASIGCVFLSRQSPRSFVAYDLQFQVQPGMILLDATADLSGLVTLMPGTERVDVPQVDFRNLTILHIEQPKEFNRKITDIVDRKVTAQPYADFIRQAVIDNTQPGEKVLVVVHKKLIDHGYIDDAPDPDHPVDWSGRKVSTINWGTGIGSNRFKNAGTVFLFSEFFIPRKTVIGNVLGMKDQQATKETLRSANGQNMTGDFLDFYEGHLLRWTKQLACRGNVRNIDPHGNCGPMRLFTTMKLERLLENQQKLFPGSPPALMVNPDGSERVKVVEQGNSSKSLKMKERKAEFPRQTIGKDCFSRAGAPLPKKGTRPLDRLAELLGHTTKDTLPSDEVESLTGVVSRNLPQALKSNTVAPYVTAFGWSLVSAKEVGLPGKRKVLVRQGQSG
jgi:hypothetical protein